MSVFLESEQKLPKSSAKQFQTFLSQTKMMKQTCNFLMLQESKNILPYMFSLSPKKGCDL